MEYMMKLRAKMHQSYSSKFHAFMTEDYSVCIFCIKGRMIEDVAHTMITDNGAEQGDYQM